MIQALSVPRADPDRADVPRAIAGDQAAFERIVHRNEARLRRLLVEMLRDRDLAEDVLQEVWSLAWRRLETFSGRARLHRWLRCIAVREALRARTRVASQQLVPFETAAHEPIDGAPCPERVSSVRDELRAALACLAGNQRGRTAFLLTSAGWSYAEVADLLGSSVGSVGTWVHRARKVLDRRAPLAS